MNKFTRKKPSLKHMLVTILLNALLLTSGCDILLPAAPLPTTATPTETFTPTPTIDWFPATATSTPLTAATPTPQPTIDDPREGVMALLVDDNFTDKNLWSTPETAYGNIAFGEDNLTLAIANPDSYLFSLSQHELSKNFYLEITLQTSLCESSDQYGIVFWRQSLGDQYQIVFNCAGQYRLELVQGGQAAVIYDWETATQMQPSHPATNRVGIWVYQGQFQLYINDAFQFEERITQDRIGQLGVFARTIIGNAMTVRFSDLQIFSVNLD